MRSPSYSRGVLLGIILGVPLAAVFYLAQQLRVMSFVPFDIFDWHSRVLPGNIITRSIDTIVRLINTFHLGPTALAAKYVEQALALLLFFTGCALAGIVLTYELRRRPEEGVSRGAETGVAFFLLVALLEISLNRLTVSSAAFMALFFTGWGAWLGMTLAGEDRVRLKTVSTALAASAVFFAAGRVVSSVMPFMGGADIPLDKVRPATRALAVMAGTLRVEARTNILPAPGTRAEVTPNRQFFRVDIDSLPPMIDSRKWRLKVSGLFSHPRDISYEDLMKFEEVTEPVTLGCISNPVGGDLTSTGFFTGIRLRDVLLDLGIDREARALTVRAYDGYYETVSYEDMFDPRTLLVYGIGGRTLTNEQGFPVRMYIPDRYGMKQPKWITSIEAVRTPDKGFWEARGWSFEARARTTAVIDAVASSAGADGKIAIGGMAWAGARGIKKVELQVDAGPWTQVRLLEPALGPLTWVLWRYDWPVQKGMHRFRVRAVDGTGELQPEEPAPPHPKGASGYHTVQRQF